MVAHEQVSVIHVCEETNDANFCIGVITVRAGWAIKAAVVLKTDFTRHAFGHNVCNCFKNTSGSGLGTSSAKGQ